MAERIPQSVAIRVAFKAYLSSDHVTEATGKTIAITISKNGAAFGNPAAGATNATEIASGWYYVDLGTGDTGTLGPLAVRGTVATIDDVGVLYDVVGAHNAGFDGVPAVAAEAAGGLYTRGTGAGQVNQPANGQLDANVAAMGSGVLTATAIAANAITAAKIATDAIGADELATDAIAEITAAIMAKSIGDSNATALNSLLRGIAAALLGIASGMGGSAPTFRDIANGKDVIVVAGADADGNRPVVTLDLT